MIANDIIIQKEEHYSKMIESLLAIDVDKEVENRLQPIKAKIQEEVKSEINADIIKCKNYLEILNALKIEMEQISMVENEEDKELVTDSIITESNTEV